MKLEIMCLYLSNLGNIFPLQISPYRHKCIPNVHSLRLSHRMRHLTKPKHIELALPKDRMYKVT